MFNPSSNRRVLEMHSLFSLQNNENKDLKKNHYYCFCIIAVGFTYFLQVLMGFFYNLIHHHDTDLRSTAPHRCQQHY